MATITKIGLADHGRRIAYRDYTTRLLPGFQLLIDPRK